MEEVVQIDMGVRWQPNVARPLLIQKERDAYLFLDPFPDRPDPTPVVIRWIHCEGALLGLPDDEARSGHRLYDRGLREVRWSGEVIDSSWIAELERRNRVHPRHDPAVFSRLHHYILPMHDSLFEVVAEGFETSRRTPGAVLDDLGR